MYSAVQGPGSACGPAGREQIQANWIEERDIFNLLQQQQQVRKDTGGDSLDVQGKLLPQAAPVLFLGFHCVEKREFDDVGPDSRTGASAQTAGGGGIRGWRQCKKKEENNRNLRQAGAGSEESGSLPDQFQLQQLLVGLENGPLGEELSQNTPEA